jgi:hypothetical protein
VHDLRSAYRANDSTSMQGNNIVVSKIMGCGCGGNGACCGGGGRGGSDTIGNGNGNAHSALGNGQGMGEGMGDSSASQGLNQQQDSHSAMQDSDEHGVKHMEVHEGSEVHTKPVDNGIIIEIFRRVTTKYPTGEVRTETSLTDRISQIQAQLRVA